MALIQSNKCLFQIKVGNDYLTVMCLKGFTVGFTTTEKETTTPIDGKYKDFDYKQLSYRASLDGVLYRETSGNTIFDFVQAQNNFLEVPFRAVYEDEAGNVKVFTGIAIVMDSNIETSAGNVGAGTVELLGKGLYLIEDTLPQYVNLRILIYNAPLSQAFVKFWLINANGEAIFQTDVLPQANGGNLANPLDITVPIPKGSWYYWFQMTSNEVGNQFDLNAPPTKSTLFNNGVFNEGSFPTQLYDFTVDRQVSFALGINTPNPVCVAPGQTGLSTDIGVEGTPYYATMYLTGSQPFTVSNVVKPAWMNISLVGNIITFSGNPTAGLNQTLSLDITNACGSAGFIGNVDISTNSNTIVVEWDFTAVGLFHIFRAYVNAVLQAQSSTAPNSGNFFANAGDTVEIQVTGQNGVTKHIDIQDSVAGEIYNQDKIIPTHSTTFVVVATHNYQVNASIV